VRDRDGVALIDLHFSAQRLDAPDTRAGTIISNRGRHRMLLDERCSLLTTAECIHFGTKIDMLSKEMIPSLVTGF